MGAGAADGRRGRGRTGLEHVPVRLPGQLRRTRDHADDGGRLLGRLRPLTRTRCSPPTGMDHLDDADEKCLGDLGEDLGDRTLADIRKADPSTSSTGAPRVTSNDAGPIRSNVAVLLLQGGDDAIVPPQDTEDLFDEMCSTAQPVTMQHGRGGGHANGARPHARTRGPWLTDRFALDPRLVELPQRSLSS